MERSDFYILWRLHDLDKDTYKQQNIHVMITNSLFCFVVVKNLVFFMNAIITRKPCNSQATFCRAMKLMSQRTIFNKIVVICLVICVTVCHVPSVAPAKTNRNSIEMKLVKTLNCDLAFRFSSVSCRSQ